MFTLYVYILAGAVSVSAAAGPFPDRDSCLTAGSRATFYARLIGADSVRIDCRAGSDSK